MASSSNRLTKYQSAVTIVTADVANSWSGGLYGSTEATNLDADNPKVVGHVHDGQHLDGHSQKVNLVNHVTGQLRNTNLADDAVTKRNVAGFIDQSDAIPISEVIDGDTYYYIDISEFNGNSDNTFTYLPGGTANSAARIYDNWEDCYDAAVVEAAIRKVDIVIDDTNGTPTITAGTYNLVNIRLIGTPKLKVSSNTLETGNVILDVDDGVTINNCSWFQNLDVTIESGVTSKFVYTLNGSPSVYRVTMNHCNFKSKSTGPVFLVKTSTLTLFAADDTIFYGTTSSGTYSTFEIEAAATVLYIELANGSGASDDAVKGPIGSLLSYFVQADSGIGDQVTTFFGTLDIDYVDLASRVYYENFTSGLTAETVQDAIDELSTPVTWGAVSVSGFTQGFASGGSWTFGVGGLERAAGNGTNAYIIPVNLPVRSGYSLSLLAMTVTYIVEDANMDDIKYTLFYRPFTADNVAHTAAVAVGGDTDGDYDAAHNTAGERGDFTGNPEYHTAIIDLSAGSITIENANDGTVGWETFVVINVDGDAGGTSVFTHRGITIHFSETFIG